MSVNSFTIHQKSFLMFSVFTFLFKVWLEEQVEIHDFEIKLQFQNIQTI